MFFILLFILLLSGCRCERHTASDLARTDTGIEGLDYRSIKKLRDTCAERQTIRIEYYYPILEGLFSSGGLGDSGTSRPASNVGSVSPGNTGGGVPAVKNIEIITERNSGTSINSTTDSTRLSQTSTKETQQQEQSSETRQDNGTVAIVTVAAAAVILVIALVLIKKILG